MKKILSIILTLVLLLSIIPLGNMTASAAFYTNTITSTSTIDNILQIVKTNDGSNCYNKMKYILYDSQFAAAYNNKFPYPNSGNSYNYVIDKGVKYTLSGSSRGCYLYADFVSQYTYGISSHSNLCVTEYINRTSGAMTATQAKEAITTYAQAGEHIRIDNTHSLAFVAYDSDGFYYTDYNNDSNPYIYLHYTTWANFAKECNNKSKIAMIYDIDLSTNSTTPILTIKYHANGGRIKADKADEIFIDSKGLMRKYSTNDYYSNNWTYGTSYSNGLINASSFGVVKDGYKFAGWSLSKNGGTVYDQTTARKPEDIYPDLKNGNATITMYAVWEPNILSVKYNANGGYITADKLATYSVNKNEIILNSSAKEYINKKNYGETWKNGLTDDTTFGLSKKCHEFIGWSLAKTGKPVYDKATKFATETFYPDIKKGDATVTVYAIWKETNHTYSNSSDTVCNECGKTRQLGSQLIKEGSVTYYYYNGVKSTSTGIFDYNGKKIYINKGRFLGATGLVSLNGKKTYINKGYFTGASGLVTIGGKKMYINKGYFTGASGLVTIGGKKMYINKGYFLGATGIVKIGSKRYYIKKGYAQLSFSGKVKISGKTYTVKKGIVK